MRGKPILGAALATVFVVSLAPPASALTIGTAGMFVPLVTTCGLLPPLFEDTASVPADAFDENGCGAEILVEKGGQTVTAKVTNRCLPCADGDIDLSPGAFNKIARPDEGRVKVTWDFIWPSAGRPP